MLQHLTFGEVRPFSEGAWGCGYRELALYHVYHSQMPHSTDAGQVQGQTSEFPGPGRFTQCSCD